MVHFWAQWAIHSTKISFAFVRPEIHLPLTQSRHKSVFTWEIKNALIDQNLLCHWTLCSDLTGDETNNLSQHWNYMHVVGNSFFFFPQKDLITCHYSGSSWNVCRPLLCNLKSPLLFTIVGFGSYNKMQNDGCACVNYHPNSASSEVHHKPATASGGSECRLCVTAVTLIQIYLLGTWNSAFLLQLCCEQHSINWLQEKAETAHAYFACLFFSGGVTDPSLEWVL